MKVFNQLIWMNYCYVGSKPWFRYWERLVICFCFSLCVDWLPQISSCLTHELGYEINVPICRTFLVYLDLLRFFIIRNFSTFFTSFKFSESFFNLGILILLTFIQTDLFLCIFQIFVVMILENVGDVMICWVFKIGACKGGLYELNQTHNRKRFRHLLLKMFLVHFPRFPVDRRMKNLSLKLYLRLIERRTTKF